MANTYSQLYIHLVFAVKGRASLIPHEHQEELHKYISGIISNKDCKVIAIGSMPDHVHIFIGLNPKISISDLVRDIKSNSSAFIKTKNWSPLFSWQDGYGAFTYSRSQLSDVANYVLHQEEHHKKRTFREEYVEILKSFGVEYDERYIFEEVH